LTDRYRVALDARVGPRGSSGQFGGGGARGGEWRIPREGKCLNSELFNVGILLEMDGDGTVVAIAEANYRTRGRREDGGVDGERNVVNVNVNRYGWREEREKLRDEQEERGNTIKRRKKKKDGKEEPKKPPQLIGQAAGSYSSARQEVSNATAQCALPVPACILQPPSHGGNSFMGGACLLLSMSDMQPTGCTNTYRLRILGANAYLFAQTNYSLFVSNSTPSSQPPSYYACWRKRIKALKPLYLKKHDAPLTLCSGKKPMGTRPLTGPRAVVPCFGGAFCAESRRWVSPPGPMSG
jgi:hypothetical protein